MSGSGSVEPLRILSDEPLRSEGSDSLGLSIWAQVIASAAVDSEGPLTIGIFGSWGVGKTTVLRQARALVDETPEATAGKVTTVLFNAWQYEREEVPLVPLLAAILHEMKKRPHGRLWRRRRGPRALRDALRAALYGFSNGIKVKSPLLGEASFQFDSAKAVDRYRVLRSRWIDREVEKSLYYNSFRALKAAQGEPSPTGRHRVIVFIDDLDRCFPDKAIHLLENIKLLLNEPGFIFVLAVDHRVLEGFLEKRFRDEFGLDGYRTSQSYLAKFVQLPLWIPTHEANFEQLVRQLLNKTPLCEHQSDSVVERIVPAIGLACGHNPRQLIRLLNDLLVDRQVHQLTNSATVFSLEMFAIARGIRLRSELVYQGLLRSPRLCEWFLDRVERLEDLETLRGTLLSRDDAGAGVVETYMDLVKRVQGDEDLLALLRCEGGRGWLRSAAEREAVESFLATERKGEPSEEWEGWVRAQTERALQQIRSDEAQSIAAGCQTLSALTSPLRLQAIPRLQELEEHADSRIRQQVERTLEELGARARALRQRR